MTIIIILGGCLVFILILQKLFKSVYLYPITEIEYNEYQKLKHNFSNARLKNLHQNLLKCIQRVENVIEYDKDSFDKMAEKDASPRQKEVDAIYWQQEINEDKQLLEEFKAMLAEVERELAARAYFNAQR